MTTRPPVVALEALEWIDSSDEERPDQAGTRLLSTVVIGGAWFHVTAYLAVDVEGEGQTYPGSWGADADAIAALDPDCGRWSTVTINGREYVLLITPHCE